MSVKRGYSASALGLIGLSLLVPLIFELLIGRSIPVLSVGFALMAWGGIACLILAIFRAIVVWLLAK